MGTFANGEPWVLGPVTVTAISPNPSESVTNVQNGSMLNPIAGTHQGFESNGIGLAATSYQASKNVALQLPLTINGNDALVSSITRPSNKYPNYVDRVCVLTVLTTAPDRGSFRTGLFGANHAVKWNKSQINWNVLKKFRPIPASAPSQAYIEERLPALPWFEWDGHVVSGIYIGETNVATRYIDPSRNIWSTYGREIAIKWGKVGLWLQLDKSQEEKEKAMIQTIQAGIDIWNYRTNGGNFYHDGGQRSGRKFPAFLAAVALNDPTLLEFVGKHPEYFQEDMTTFYVSEKEVYQDKQRDGTPIPGKRNPNNLGYTPNQIGLPEWGIRHYYEPYQDNSSWGSNYRHVNWPANFGSVLAADLMGRKAAWGHPPIFDYNDRYKSAGGVSGFFADMYNFK